VQFQSNHIKPLFGEAILVPDLCIGCHFHCQILPPLQRLLIAYEPTSIELATIFTARYGHPPHSADNVVTWVSMLATWIRLAQ
jgi:hypothetical protein